MEGMLQKPKQFRQKRRWEMVWLRRRCLYQAFALVAEGSRFKTTALRALRAAGPRAHALCREHWKEELRSATGQPHAAPCAQPYTTAAVITHTASSSRSSPAGCHSQLPGIFGELPFRFDSSYSINQHRKSQQSLITPWVTFQYFIRNHCRNSSQNRSRGVSLRIAISSM